MACYDKKTCSCNSSNIKSYGLVDTSRIIIDGSDRTALNWSEISAPDIVTVPIQKPDIENIDQVYVTTDLSSVKLIETPVAYDSYDILATAGEIADVGAVVNSITTNVYAPLGVIVNSLNTILSTPLLPATNPLIVQLQAVVQPLTNLLTSLDTVLTNATTTLGSANVTRKQLCDIITQLTNLLKSIETTLLALPALLQSIINDSILGPIIGVAVTTLLGDVNDLLAAITTELLTLTGLANICTVTTVIVIKANEEGTCLSGRKLVIEGTLNEKIVYTANVDVQSVHSAHFSVPFSAFVIPYANFENAQYETDVPVLINGVRTLVNGFILGSDEELIPNLCEEFCLDAYIEDIFAHALDERTVFVNITLFLLAKVSKQCS